MASFWVKTVVQAFLAVGLFFIIDQIWLVFFSKQFYLREYSKVQNAPVHPRLRAAMVWYSLAAIAVAFYVLPRLKGAGIGQAMAYGALMGLIVYGSNNATNRSLFGGYSKELAAVDTAWGTFMFMVVTVLLYKFQ